MEKDNPEFLLDINAAVTATLLNGGRTFVFPNQDAL